MNRVQLGRACVTRIVEFQFELGTKSFANTPPSGWEDNADLLVPDFFDPDTDKWRIAVQSWVVEVHGLTVLVDTGVGNDRERPHMPPLPRSRRCDDPRRRRTVRRRRVAEHRNALSDNDLRRTDCEPCDATRCDGVAQFTRGA